MPRSFGEPLTKLRAVPIRENGEPLVDPRGLSGRIRFADKTPKFDEMPRRPEVRRRVAEMLAEAAGALPDGLDLLLFEGFRSPGRQRFMYDGIRDEFAQRHPEWSRATLHRMTNRMSAPPDDRCPPPHSTGGAFDLTLVRLGEDTPLDMTSPYAWDETSAPMDARGLSAEARANRVLLSTALTAAGLTNYVGEWWHWSYGDSGWALRTGAPFAIYDRLADG
jgi:D-alanyl-D-alanine dipeptidase